MNPPEGLSAAEEARWYADRAQRFAADAQHRATQALWAAFLAGLIGLAALVAAFAAGQGC
jgi:hypothetical protein